jgi:hypothetical protein
MYLSVAVSTKQVTLVCLCKHKIKTLLHVGSRHTKKLGARVAVVKNKRRIASCVSAPLALPSMPVYQ